MNREPPPRQKRETIMEQRLRKARGETVDERLEFYDHDDTADDDGDVPLLRREPVEEPYAAMHPLGGYMGSGCTQKIVLFSLVALTIGAIVLLLGSMDLSNLPNPFRRFLPDVPAMVGEPTPTIRTDSAAVVKRVQQLNRLETTSYTVEKVIEAGIQGNAFQDLLFGDRLLLIAHGTVIAGIDMSTLQANDVTISTDGKTLIFHMPPVEIFSVMLDNSRTRVYDRQQGLLAAPNKDLESKARQVAEAEILKAACEGGMMQRATEDAQRSLEQLLSMFDFEHIEVVPAAIPTCPDYEAIAVTS
jgi:hypothetical protein